LPSSARATLVNNEFPRSSVRIAFGLVDEQGDLHDYLAGWADGAARRPFTEPPGMDEPSCSLTDLIKMYEHGRRVEREKNRALYRGLDPEVAVLAARFEAKVRVETQAWVVWSSGWIRKAVRHDRGHRRTRAGPVPGPLRHRHRRLPADAGGWPPVPGAGVGGGRLCRDRPPHCPAPGR
jgi:hypothetical protein